MFILIKYMLDNDYIKQVYITWKLFPVFPISLLSPWQSFMSNFKRARKRFFQWSNYVSYVNKTILFQLINNAYYST